ncbi:DUF5990 family protein [Altererythrobacter sp. Root672]|uniref:DUF5990 family protein n=1 Tax=Altererythrobacter sp. Root672 TaxID=1736584 RepID=UPI0006FCC3C6|nr:DUF5990 family protein [Altererythrobacter sp. Root672]KRA80535.1 hypothetical protein ASD76_15350 [Altererythrobacter sp. Root672]
MARADQIEIRARLVIEQPVPGVLHSLQEDDAPLDPKTSKAGEPLAFDFPLRIERTEGGAKLFGKQVRREGPERRFVYIRIGTLAGDCASPWTRKMKIDIHDIESALLDKAAAGGLLVGRINGTAKDGSPVCATVKPVTWRVV